MKSTFVKILLVVSIVGIAYYLWKKGVFGKHSSQEAEFEADEKVTTADPDEFNKELTAFMTRQNSKINGLKLDGNKLSDTVKADVAKTVRNIYIWCHDDKEDHWSKDAIARSARNSGRTLDNQYLVSALWALSEDGWSDKTLFTSNEYEELIEKL